MKMNGILNKTIKESLSKWGLVLKNGFVFNKKGLAIFDTQTDEGQELSEEVKYKVIAFLEGFNSAKEEINKRLDDLRS